MRKSRKNQKQYIIWSNHQQQHIEINPNHPQQAKKEVEKIENKSN